MKKFDRTIFLAATILCWFMTFLSFVFSNAQDEGTLPDNIFALIIAKSFDVFAFPGLLLMASFMVMLKDVSLGLLLTYFFALWISGVVYGIGAERLIYIFKKHKHSTTN